MHSDKQEKFKTAVMLDRRPLCQLCCPREDGTCCSCSVRSYLIKPALHSSCGSGCPCNTTPANREETELVWNLFEDDVPGLVCARLLCYHLQNMAVEPTIQFTWDYQISLGIRSTFLEVTYQMAKLVSWAASITEKHHANLFFDFTYVKLIW